MITQEIKNTILQYLCLEDKNDFCHHIMEGHPEIKKVVISYDEIGAKFPIYIHLNSGHIFLLKLIDSVKIEDTLIKVMEVKESKEE